MRPVKTIRHILPSPRDPYTTEDKSCVVYQIPCSDCDYVYIGQTKRGLKSRLADHRRATSQQRLELDVVRLSGQAHGFRFCCINFHYGNRACIQKPVNSLLETILGKVE